MKPENKKAEPKMDPNALYREEIFTDHQTGTIRRLSPVKADGTPDTVRKTIYIGDAQLMTSAGALPLSFEIEAQSLGEAAQKYGEEQLRLQGAALSAAANGIVITDRAGKIIWANAAFSAMTGYELREVQGRATPVRLWRARRAGHSRCAQKRRWQWWGR